MTRWETKVLLSDGPKPDKHLEEAGNEGWELVTVLSFMMAGGLAPKGVFGFFFKRPKPEVLD